MTQELILQYVILGALAGIIYGLRRIYTVERQLAALEVKMDMMLSKKMSAMPKKKRR